MRPGYYFCVCPDFEIINDFIQEKVKKLNGNWEQKIIWPDDENLNKKVFELFNTSSIIPKNTVAILKNAEKLPPSLIDSLSKFLNRFYDNLLLFILVENDWQKNKPNIPKNILKQKYYKFAEKKGWIFIHPGVTEHFLINYLKEFSRQKKISIDDEVFNVLVEILPRNLAGIKNELKKLYLFCEGEKITKDHLKVIFPSLNYDIFELINSIEGITSNELVWKVISNNEINTHESLMHILHLMLREARILWQILHNEQVYIPLNIKQKKAYLAQKIGESNIIEIFNIICDADLKIKTTSIPPSKIFETTVSKLQKVFMTHG